jgi:hypothetical protein
MHFGDTKPAFAGHGAVLLEVEGQEFYEHLKELLAEERPDLVDAVVPFMAVELKPAAMVRVKKELVRSTEIATNIDGPWNTLFRRIGSASQALMSHAEDLREVLPEMEKSSERRILAMRRHAQIVSECWELLGRVNSCTPTGVIHVPHPLTKEIETISLLLEQSLPCLSDCDFHDAGSNGIKTMIESITCVDPDGMDVMTEYLFVNIQSAEQFIARLAIRFGEGRDCLTTKDKEVLDATRNSIAKYAKQRAAQSKKSAKEWRSASSQIPRTLGKTGGNGKAGTSVGAPAPSGSSADPADQDANTVEHPADLAIDVDHMTVRCNGKTVIMDGLKHRRFKLLQLLLDQPGIALSHKVLCGSGNPWMGNKSHKISVSAIKSIVRELKKDLKPLGLLPVIIKTQSFEGELRPLLKRK